MRKPANRLVNDSLQSMSGIDVGFLGWDWGRGVRKERGFVCGFLQN